jgi:hypothetical protein
MGGRPIAERSLGVPSPAVACSIRGHTAGTAVACIHLAKNEPALDRNRQLNGPVHAIFQPTIAPGYQGRVFTLLGSLAAGAAPLGTARCCSGRGARGCRSLVLGRWCSLRGDGYRGIVGDYCAGNRGRSARPPQTSRRRSRSGRSSSRTRQARYSTVTTVSPVQESLDSPSYDQRWRDHAVRDRSDHAGRGDA